MLGGETLQVYECQVHKSLHKSEIPAIAKLKPIVYIFLTNAINKVAKEEARRADEELLPPGSIRKRDTEQKPCLLFVPHLVGDRPIKSQSKNNEKKRSIKIACSRGAAWRSCV